MKKVILFTSLFVLGMLHVKAQVVLVDNCDAVTAEWTARTNVLSIDNTDFKEGKGAFKSEGTHAFRFRLMRANRINTGTDGKSGYLSFSLFVDRDDLNEKPGYVCISSTDKAEIDAHRWSLKNVPLKKGWNNVVLEMSSKSASGGDFDGNLKYFVVVQPTSTSAVFKLDNIRFAKTIEELN